MDIHNGVLDHLALSHGIMVLLTRGRFKGFASTGPIVSLKLLNRKTALIAQQVWLVTCFCFAILCLEFFSSYNLVFYLGQISGETVVSNNVNFIEFWLEISIY